MCNVARPSLEASVIRQLRDTDDKRARALTQKFVLNANANGAGIKWESAAGNGKMRHKSTMLGELDAFIAASPSNTFLTDLTIDQWSDSTVTEVLGATLGERTLRYVAAHQAKMAKAADITNDSSSGDANESSASKVIEQTTTNNAEVPQDHNDTRRSSDSFKIPRKKSTLPDDDEDTFRKEAFQDETAQLSKVERERVHSYLQLVKQGGCVEKILVHAMTQASRMAPPVDIEAQNAIDDSLSQMDNQHSVSSTMQAPARRLKLPSRDKASGLGASILSKWKISGAPSVAHEKVGETSLGTSPFNSTKFTFTVASVSRFIDTYTYRFCQFLCVTLMLQFSR